METIKSYKIRIYPTKEQEILIRKHIGHSRFIWNYMLELQKKRFANNEKHLSCFETINLITPLRKTKECEWLQEVSRNTLNIICDDLSKAYSEGFKKRKKMKPYEIEQDKERNKYLPRFKDKKRNKPSYPIGKNKGKFYFSDLETVTIPVLGKVKYKTKFQLPLGREVKFTNPRISLQGKKWILSFGMEFEKQEFQLNDFSVGIDLGLRDTAIIYYNGNSKKFHNINKSKYLKILNRRLKHLQRIQSRKERMNTVNKKVNVTKGIEKIRVKVRELNNRIANIRQNYRHHITREIADLLPFRVVMEDLNIKGMMKNRCRSRAIGEQGWYEIIRQMQYKCEWRVIEFIQADRFYPSSKLCNNCGNKKKNLPSGATVYKCDECGFEFDRDVHAAKNLAEYVV